jgi:hypothetical protein
VQIWLLCACGFGIFAGLILLGVGSQIGDLRESWRLQLYGAITLFAVFLLDAVLVMLIVGSLQGRQRRRLKAILAAG